jgi:hypothetical protein
LAAVGAHASWRAAARSAATAVSSTRNIATTTTISLPTPYGSRGWKDPATLNFYTPVDPTVYQYAFRPFTNISAAAP